jgi:hypothetical protein
MKLLGNVLLPIARRYKWMLRYIVQVVWRWLKTHRTFVRRTVLALYIIVALLPAQHSGKGIALDTFEYHAMLNAWLNHATPDIRLPDRPRGSVWPDIGLYASPVNGGVYCWHFWLYALCAVPVRWWLQATGADPLSAFYIMNRWLFLAVSYVLLFGSWAPLRRRLLLFVLATVNVIPLYLWWEGPELWSWSLVLLAFTQFERRRYIGAAALSALAAMQNLPLCFLSMFFAAASWRHSGWRIRLLATIAALTSLLPLFFFQALFGRPSLIALHGHASPAYMSGWRVWSFFSDVNQGLFFYVPALVLLWLVTLIYSFKRRQWMVPAVSLLLLAIVGATSMAVNWNSGCVGLMRYGVWIVPITAWIVMHGLPQRFVHIRLLAGIAMLQMLLTTANEFRGPYTHRPLARWILSEFPAFYNPEPEIFTDRTLTVETWRSQGYPYLPVAFVRQDGTVAKILTDSQHLPLISRRFKVTPDYEANTLRNPKQRSGLFYLNPPRGEVVERPRRS